MISLLTSFALWLAAISSVHGFVSPVHKNTPTAFVTKQHVSVPSHLPRERGCVLYMGWGPEPVWSGAQVETTEVANESGTTVRMLVQVPAETAAEYSVPGQYVQLTLNNETQPLFLAIASAPDAESPSFEFLIKKTENNGWMTGAQPGTQVTISQVLGNGFPIGEHLEGFKYDFPTQNILLFSAGSGIAPIKAAMESGQLNVAAGEDGGGRTARLYYGVQTAADLCFVDKFQEWESMGFQVVPVLSRPGPGWNGRTGYVQNCLEEDGVPIPRNSGALLCGQKEMAQSVTDILTKAGVFGGRILSNF
jgi:NAD(P)H-flavin reductase